MVMAAEITREYLKYTFDEDEKKELADKMADCISKKIEAEGNLKSIQTQFKSEIAKVDAELSQASEKYRSGFEMRNIECRVDRDYGRGVITIFRCDTGEFVKERAMTAEERQQDLPM